MADSNGTNKNTIPVDPITRGVQAVADIVSKDQQNIAEDAKDLAKQAEVAERAEIERENAAHSYTASIKNLKRARDAMTKQVYDAEQTEKESGAEKQAADVVAQGGAVTIGEALEMLKNEKRATELRKKAEKQMFDQTLQYGQQVLSSGVAVVMEEAKDFFGGQRDAFGFKSVATLLSGGAVGLALSADSPLSGLGNVVTDAVAGYAELKSSAELDDGVEEKSIDGLEDEAAYQQYMENNAGGEPSDPYAAENSDGAAYDGAPKEFGSSNYTVQETTDPGDALKISDEDLDMLTDPDRLAAEADMLAAAQADQQAGSDGLLSSVVSSDVGQAIIGAVAKNMGLTPQAEPEIPDVPDEAEFAGLEL